MLSLLIIFALTVLAVFVVALKTFLVITQRFSDSRVIRLVK